MHATMEHMTIWGLISDASLLVKGVMLILLLVAIGCGAGIGWLFGAQRWLLRHLSRLYQQLRRTRQ